MMVCTAMGNTSLNIPNRDMLSGNVHDERSESGTAKVGYPLSNSGREEGGGGRADDDDDPAPRERAGRPGRARALFS